jgi:hypothetical protein
MTSSETDEKLAFTHFDFFTRQDLRHLFALNVDHLVSELPQIAER